MPGRAKRVPPVHIDEGLAERLNDFKKVVDVILEESLDEHTYLNLVLEKGLDSMMNDLLGPQDSGTLLDSVKQMGMLNPGSSIPTSPRC